MRATTCLERLGLTAALAGAFLWASLSLAGASVASAQEDDEVPPGISSTSGSDGEAPTPTQTAAGASSSSSMSSSSSDDEAPPRSGSSSSSAEEPESNRRDPADPYEEENEDYFFLDFFYRHVIVPEFIQQVFLDEGVTGSLPGFGLDLTYRKNGFNVVLSAWYLGAGGPFSVTGTFREQGEPRTTTEVIETQLHLAFVTAAFMWSVNFTDWLALEIGLDVGFGMVFGNLIRTEAHESSSGQGDWRRCNGVGDPNPTYCEGPEATADSDGGHYNFVEGTWVDGPRNAQDIPFLFPWIALPHLALRIKPIHFMQMRVEAGYNVWGFFFGGSLGVGF